MTTRSRKIIDIKFIVEILLLRDPLSFSLRCPPRTWRFLLKLFPCLWFMFQLKAWFARAAERLIPSQTGLALHDTLSFTLFIVLLVFSPSLVTYVCLKEINHPDK